MIPGLTAVEIKLVTELLKKHLPSGTRVECFGSRAEGTHRANSDLDLLLIYESEIDRAALQKLREAFEESRLSYKVDLVEERRISESFKTHLAHSKKLTIL